MGGWPEEIAEVSLKVLDKYLGEMSEEKKSHIRKEALSCSFRALDNYACERVWTSYQRVLDLVDLMTWDMTPGDSAEFNIVRLRIDNMNGYRGVAEVTAKNTLVHAKANRWRGFIAAASSVLSSIAWHNGHEH